MEEVWIALGASLGLGLLIGLERDPIVLSSLNLFGHARLSAKNAIAAIAVAYTANAAFKLGVLVWYDRRLARRVLWPLVATIAGGAAAYFWPATS